MKRDGAITVLAVDKPKSLSIVILVYLAFLSALQTECSASLRADINSDRTVNFIDLSILASEWLAEDSGTWPSTTSSVTFAATYGSPLCQNGESLVFFDDFNDCTKWTAGVGSRANGTVHSVFRDTSMKVTGGSHGTYPIMIWRDVDNLDFNACTFRLRYYVESNAGLNRHPTSAWPLMVYFDASNNFSRYAQLINTPVEEGVWHDVVWTSSELAVAGGFNFATDPIKRIYVRCAGNTSVITERPVIFLEKFEIYRNDNTGPAKVIIGLDDAWAKLPDSQYEGLMYAASKGIRTYCALATDQIGINPDFMTWQQVRDLYATGLVNMHAHMSVPPYGRGEQALREYCIKAKQDMLDHGISGPDAEVFVMPSGTDGAPRNYIPTAEDVLVLKDYFRIVRGTGGFWTGAGYIKEIGSFRTRGYISTNRPQEWWTYALGIGPTADIEDKISRAKAHGTVLSIYAHLGVTNDLTLDQWKTVIDIIAAARDRGDVEILSLLDI